MTSINERKEIYGTLSYILSLDLNENYITRHHIINSFNKLETIGSKEDAIEWLRVTVTEINNQIFEYATNNPESKGLGTTLVIAIKTEDYILYGNIGDSSGYAYKNNKLYKVTKDRRI